MDKGKEEDYGDYVTRCVCGFEHDDGYMIQCDGCSVWQHVECMQVNPKNLPDKYLCEECEPRSVDKRKARQIQLKKREDMSDLDDEDRSTRASSGDSQKLATSSQGVGAKKKKRGKMLEAKADSKRFKKDKPESSCKKVKRKPPPKASLSVQQAPRTSSIQSLLTAASILDQDVWSATASPWADRYDLADHNLYSDPVKVFLSSQLSQLKTETAVYSQEEYCTAEACLPHPQCTVSEVQRRRKGVIAAVGIAENKIVTEYKGKVTTKHSVLSDMVPSVKSLWRRRPCPFVYLYDKIPDLDVCIDARHYGNIARFIRRSCSPNTELRHFFISNELHFGVYALHSIPPGEEITLPFDFRYEKCDYAVECACGQKASCLVARANHVILHRKQLAPKSVVEEESHTRSSPRHRSHVLHDEDSNSSWTSTSSRRKRHHPPSLSPPLQHSSRQASREVSSDSDDDTGSEGKRRKSREERKTEAVWRMFEKMEASAQRKRHQLCSEGSMDSDSLSSPSTLHPQPLLPFKPGKERRTSSSSKKVQLLPGGKVRLSSVSSNDALSPAEFSEAFSPPTLSSFPPHSLPYTSPLHSPPFSSPPTTPKPCFEITPHLHPNYLFADFAIPRKKAILQQWAAEKEHSNIPSYLVRLNGHSHHPHPNKGVARQRGSLKHRWLKQHSEQLASGRDKGASSVRSGSDKENEKEGEPGGDKREPQDQPQLPHKKNMLQRWQAGGGATTAITPKEPDNAQTEPAVAPNDAHQDMQMEDEAQKPPQGGLTTRESQKESLGIQASTLFEDFSDDDEEFESPTRDRGHSFLLSEEGRVDLGEEESRDAMREGPHTPPLEGEGEEEGAGSCDVSPAASSREDLNLSSISDTSLHSEEEEEEEEEEDGEAKAPFSDQPPLSTVTSSSSINVSDISSELDLSCEKDEEGVESGTTAVEPDRQDSTEPVRLVEQDLASARDLTDDGRDMGIGRGSLIGTDSQSLECEHVPQSVGGNESDSEAIQEVEMEPASPPSKAGETDSQTVSPVSTLSSVEDLGHIPERIGAESLVAAMGTQGSSIGTGQITKTPGKRKINLSEYRNRARKPADQRKPSTEKSSPPPPPPPPTSVTPFLSHVISTQAAPSMFTPTFTSSSLLSSMKGATPSSSVPVSVSSVPQFEPVSPDEEGMTPPVINMEDSTSVIDRLGSAYSAPGTMVSSDQAAYQRPPQSSGYVMDTRWNVPSLEHTQDPRRVLQGSEMYPHGVHPLPHAHPLPSHPHQQDVTQPASAIHGGLLPHPPPHPNPPPPTFVVQPPEHQGGMVRPGEFHLRQSLPPRPRGYPPHRQPRGAFPRPSGPRHPGPSSGFY